MPATRAIFLVVFAGSLLLRLRGIQGYSMFSVRMAIVVMV
jgi:hypothetical protein